MKFVDTISKKNDSGLKKVNKNSAVNQCGMKVVD